VSPGKRGFLALASFGIILEGSLLAFARAGNFQNPRVALFTVSFLLVFWASISLALFAVGDAAGRLSRNRSPAARHLVLAGLLVLLAPVVFAYLASWSVFLRVGQFLNFEALEYALTDYRAMTWFYVRQSEPLSVAAAVGAAGLCLVLLGALLRTAFRTRTGGGPPHPLRPLILYTLALALLCFLSFRWVLSEKSETRLPSELETLGKRVNPLLTLAVSWWEGRSLERIEPSLRVSELRPIAGTRWAPPAPTNRNRPSILFLKIESFRQDALGQSSQGTEITPNINRLAREGLMLTRAYTQATHTDYADVSTLSSLYPLRSRRHHYYQAIDPWPKKLIYDLLAPAGYAAAIVSAENLAWGRMDQFLATPALSLLYDSERSGAKSHAHALDAGIAGEIRRGVLKGGTMPDADVTDVALHWVSRQVEAGRPFFLNLDLQSPHFPYVLPPKHDRPFQPSRIDFEVSFISYSPEKTPILRNAYNNALHEADRQVGRLLETLKRLKRLENTVIVVYGDHGEAFNEQGLVTHGGPPIEPVARVPCVIYAPAYVAAGRDDYPTGLIDVVPTVLGLIGWPLHPNLQGIDVLAKDRPAAEERLLFLHTDTPMSHTDAVIRAGRWKLTRNRGTGDETLNDLAADPAGEINVAGSHPAERARLQAVLQLWRTRQLAYYHYPMYYTRFYPPSPPPAPAADSGGQRAAADSGGQISAMDRFPNFVGTGKTRPGNRRDSHGARSYSVPERIAQNRCPVSPYIRIIRSTSSPNARGSGVQRSELTRQ